MKVYCSFTVTAPDAYGGSVAINERLADFFNLKEGETKQITILRCHASPFLVDGVDSVHSWTFEVEACGDIP